MRCTRALLVALVLALVMIITLASPASAHGIGGVSPTNYETRIATVKPEVRGLSVRPADLGEKLELENRSSREVVVLGYDGEPYLRVDARGTFENRRSPARFLNRTVTASTPIPDSADPDAPPEWRRIGDGTTVQWHDHRAHWMGRADPPAVQRDRGAMHRVQRLRVDLEVDGQPVRVTGDVRWVPGPALGLWLAAAILIALTLAIAGRTRHWGRALGIGVVTLGGAAALHVAGRFGSSTDSTLSTIGASGFELVGLVLVAATLVVLVTRGAFAAAPPALMSGVTLLVTSGLADIADLSHSQTATTLPAWLNRLAITLTIGAAIGVSVVAWWHLTPGPRGFGSSRTRSRDTRAPGLRARSRNAPTASS